MLKCRPSKLAHCSSLKSFFCLEHGSELQERNFILRPTQYFPPFLGTGRLHSRTAILIPPPQVLEHVPKGLQTPQAPSTGTYSCSLWMHRPCLQCFPGAQSVPSAHGMCWVRQPRWTPSGLVHHNLRHCVIYGHTCVPGPNISSHCLLTLYICPGSCWDKLYGLETGSSSKHSPYPVSRNSVMYFRLHLDHIQGLV